MERVRPSRFRGRGEDDDEDEDVPVAMVQEETWDFTAATDGQVGGLHCTASGTFARVRVNTQAM